MNVVNLYPNKALKILITTEKPKNLPCRGFVWYLNLNGDKTEKNVPVWVCVNKSVNGICS